MKVNIFEAKTNLSKLIQEAVKGEEVIIANRGEALVKLTPVLQKGMKNYGSKKEAWGSCDQAFNEETEALVSGLFDSSGYDGLVVNEKPPFKK